MAPPSGSVPSSSSTSAQYAPLDSTYTSLYSLLAAPPSSSAHLALLPPAALYTSLTLYLARLPHDILPDFVKLLATSRTLWHTNALVYTAHSRIHEDVTSPEHGVQEQPSLLRRAYQLHLAVARAVFSQVELLLTTEKGSTGWLTQRKLGKWIRLVHDSLGETEPPVSPFVDNGIHLPKLAILTGILVGLTAYRQQENKDNRRGLNVKKALHTAQSSWITCFSEVIWGVASLGLSEGQESSTPSSSGVPENQWESEFALQALSSQSGDSNRDMRAARVSIQALIPLYLAAQVASASLSEGSLDSIPAEPILEVIPCTILRMYYPKTLHFSADPSQLISPVTHALFPLLGPLSRLLAHAAEKAADSLRAEEVTRMLLDNAFQSRDSRTGAVSDFVERASQLHDDFVRSGMADTVMKDLRQESQSRLTDVWSSLKSFLFVTVQLFDAVLDGLVETLPSPVFAVRKKGTEMASEDEIESASNIPLHILQILTLQLQGLMKLSFVTFSLTNPNGPSHATDGRVEPSKITSNEIYDRFTTYRHTFYGALEVVKTDSGASMYLLRSLEKDLPPIDTAIEQAWHPRSKITLALDVYEQLIGSLPDETVEDIVLQRCRPYLRDATYPGLFESAHSCVLAIFESKKRSCRSLAPFYVECLIESFPRHTSLAQLSHALRTVIACLSDLDDAEAFYVIERLEREIEGEDASAQKQSITSKMKDKGRGRLSFEPPSQSTPPPKKKKELEGDSDSQETVKDNQSVMAAQAQHQQQQQQELKDESKPSTQSSSSSSLRALHLQLAYIDTLPFVNLVLLRSVLDKVRGYILQARLQSRNSDAHLTTTTSAAAPAEQKQAQRSLNEEKKEQSAEVSVQESQSTMMFDDDAKYDEEEEDKEDKETSAHLQLCRRTFKALDEMDDTARQEGVRWWLECRKEFGV